MSRNKSLLLSLVVFLVCVGVGLLVGMPYARLIIAFGVVQIGVVSWVTKEQEKKS